MTVKIEDKLFLDRFKVDEESHLKIMDSDVCKNKCEDQACLYFCPAYVYRMEGDRIAVTMKVVWNAALAASAAPI